MLQEVRMARIVDAIGRHTSGALTCLEAASLLGMSERHFRWLYDANEAGGPEAIVDRPPGARERQQGGARHGGLGRGRVPHALF